MPRELPSQYVKTRDAETGQELQLPRHITDGLHEVILMISQPLTEEKAREITTLRSHLRKEIAAVNPGVTLEKLEKDYLFSFLKNSGPLGDLQQQHKLLQARNMHQNIPIEVKELFHSIHLQFLRLQQSGLTTDVLYAYWRLGSSTLQAITENESSQALPLLSVKKHLDILDQNKKYDVVLTHLRRVTYETWLMGRLLNSMEAGILDISGKKASVDFAHKKDIVKEDFA